MIALLFTVLIVVGGVGAEKVLESGEINRAIYWFNGYKDRGTTCYRCIAAAEGINFRIPKPMECNIPINNETSKAVTVTTYWGDRKMNLIDAFECFGESQKYLLSTYSGGITHVKVFKLGKEYVHLPASDCRTMMNEGITPKGDKLHDLGTKLRGTNITFDPTERSRWWYEVKFDIVNYFVQEILMTVDIKSDVVEPVGAVPKIDCKVSKGHCPTTRGVMVWEPQIESSCRVIIGRKSACLQTGNRISCNSVALSLVADKVEEICGVNVARSVHGVRYSTEIAGEVFEEVGATQQILAQINPKLPPSVASRYRRDINDEEIGIVSRKEFESNMQWVLNLLHDKLEAMRWTYHVESCRSAKIMTESLIHSAAKGDVTDLVVSMTGDKSYRGMNSGDIITVWQCAKINRYFFMDRVNCTIEQPIKYFHRDESREGWLKPITHEIVDEPTEIQCDPPPFYFESDLGLIDLTNKKYVHNIDYLPNPGESAPPEARERISFQPGGIYTDNDITGRKEMRKMQKALNNAVVLLETIGQIGNGEETSKEGEDLLSKFRAELGFWFYVKLILGVVVFIAIIVTAHYVHAHWVPIRNLLKGIGRFFVHVSKCLCGCCCKTEDKDKTARERKKSKQEDGIELGNLTPQTTAIATQQSVIFCNERSGMKEPRYIRRPLPSAPLYSDIGMTEDVRRSRIYPNPKIDDSA